MLALVGTSTSRGSSVIGVWLRPASTVSSLASEKKKNPLIRFYNVTLWNVATRENNQGLSRFSHTGNKLLSFRFA